MSHEHIYLIDLDTQAILNHPTSKPGDNIQGGVDFEVHAGAT